MNATAAFDVDALTDIKGAQYDENVDFTDGEDGPSWRIYTTSAQAHAAVRRRLADFPAARGIDCSDVLDKVDREDGGLFGCWIVSLRA